MNCPIQRALAARRRATDGRNPEFTCRHFAAIEEPALPQATWNLCRGNEGWERGSSSGNCRGRRREFVQLRDGSQAVGNSGR